MPRKLTNEEFLQRLKDNNVIDYIPLEEYKGAHEKIKWHCNIHDVDFYGTPNTMWGGQTSCRLCDIEKKSLAKMKTNVDFLNEAKIVHPDFEVLTEYIGCNEKIWFRCPEGHEFDSIPYDFLTSKGCPICMNVRALPGFNTIWDVHPELNQYIHKDYIEFAKNTTIGCPGSKKIKFICPNCNNEIEITVETYIKNGISCPICRDSLSYPNKMLRGILFTYKDILDDIQFEYKINYKGRIFFYDGSFYYNNKHYLVEMDGGFHTLDRTFFNGRHILEKSQERDKLKNEYTIENDIILIRINCPNSSLEEIKEEVYNSKLSNFLDLSKINWFECDRKSQSNETKNLAEIISLNSGLSMEELKEVTGLSREKIKRAYKSGVKFNWCKESDLVKKKIVAKPVKVINKKTGKFEIFNNSKDFVKEFNNRGITDISINNVVKNSLSKKLNKIGYEVIYLTKKEYIMFLQSKFILPDKNENIILQIKENIKNYVKEGE